jgi:hypothetical protein
VTVDLDGAVLVDGALHELQPQPMLEAVLYPQQEIAVRRLAVRAAGL